MNLFKLPEPINSLQDFIEDDTSIKLGVLEDGEVCFAGKFGKNCLMSIDALAHVKKQVASILGNANPRYGERIFINDKAFYLSWVYVYLQYNKAHYIEKPNFAIVTTMPKVHLVGIYNHMTELHFVYKNMLNGKQCDMFKLQTQVDYSNPEWVNKILK